MDDDSQNWDPGVVDEVPSLELALDRIGGKPRRRAVAVVGPRRPVPRGRRVFAAFDAEADALTVARQLKESGLGPRDVWLYRGRDGSRRLDVPGRLARELLARLVGSTSAGDAARRERLRRTVELGGAVLAIRAVGRDLALVRAVLRRGGAHSVARIERLQLVPLPPEDDLALTA